MLKLIPHHNANCSGGSGSISSASLDPATIAAAAWFIGAIVSFCAHAALVLVAQFAFLFLTPTVHGPVAAGGVAVVGPVRRVLRDRAFLVLLLVVTAMWIVSLVIFLSFYGECRASEQPWMCWLMLILYLTVPLVASVASIGLARVLRFSGWNRFLAFLSGMLTFLVVSAVLPMVILVLQVAL